MGSLVPVSDDMANDFPIGLINNVLCEKQHRETGYSDVKTPGNTSQHGPDRNSLNLPQRSGGENLNLPKCNEASNLNLPKRSEGGSLNLILPLEHPLDRSLHVALFRSVHHIVVKMAQLPLQGPASGKSDQLVQALLFFYLLSQKRVLPEPVLEVAPLRSTKLIAQVAINASGVIPKLRHARRFFGGRMTALSPGICISEP